MLVDNCSSRLSWTPCWPACVSKLVMPGPRHRLLVVISCLQEVDPTFSRQVDDTVLLRQASGPDSRRQELEGLGLPDPFERIPDDGLNEIKRAQRDLPVGCDPVAEVVEKLRVEDGVAPRCRWPSVVGTSSPP